MRVEVRCGSDVLHGGTVECGVDGARLSPPREPMFDQVLAMLETLEVKRVRAPTLKQEARAAVAVCLRWGSYLALLMDDQRPPAPAVGRPGVSRVTDREMARINIEASANLSRWLTLAHEDAPRYAKLVHAAQKLPLAKGGDLRPVALTNMVQPKLLELTASMAAHAPAEAADVRRAPMRSLANAFVNTCWRNGPIEDLHAGEASPVLLMERRFTREEAALLQEEVIARMMDAVDAFWLLEPDWGSPRFAEYALAYRLMPCVGPSGWSTTEDSRAIELRAEELAELPR